MLKLNFTTLILMVTPYILNFWIICTYFDIEDRHIQIFDDAIIQLDFIVKNRIYSEKYQVIEDIWSMIQNLHRFSSLNSLVINFNEVKNSFGEFIYSEIKNLWSKVCLSKDKIWEESQISKVVFHMIISK